ncbi:MAG: Mth938-like domain-containing protein [Gammaproteobacteria bacterium]|nr:Mth938-like domain-containing protein [Gammaproteobacteria bacterium]TDJ11986.1 MAG: hypothetical protein E2O64_02540 [Gammaproteobacteria bacterium]
MKIVRDNAGAGLLVRSYERGRIRVRDQYYDCPLIIDRHHVQAWLAENIETLDLAQLEPALADRPDVLLLGCGAVRIQPPQRLIADLGARGIGLEVMDSGAACRTYNILACENRSVVAALLA